jgi:hypothetical protein
MFMHLSLRGQGCSGNGPEAYFRPVSAHFSSFSAHFSSFLAQFSPVSAQFQGKEGAHLFLTELDISTDMGLGK